MLKTLDLFDNRIGDEGAKALASALRVNAVLKSIDEEERVIRDAVSGRAGFKLKLSSNCERS